MAVAYSRHVTAFHQRLTSSCVLDGLSMTGQSLRGLGRPRLLTLVSLSMVATSSCGCQGLERERIWWRLVWLLQARDLPADDIASALQSLLLPASAASAAPVVPSASSHTQQLRSRAEQAVSAAEPCGPSPERPYLVASATVSAAALEGFSDQVLVNCLCSGSPHGT